jgi:hypothetical protein
MPGMADMHGIAAPPGACATWLAAGAAAVPGRAASVHTGAPEALAHPESITAAITSNAARPIVRFILVLPFRVPGRALRRRPFRNLVVGHL